MLPATQTQPLLSVVIVVHNMQRVTPRTLHSFTAAYQGVSPDLYEVIVVENGSDHPLSSKQVEAFGPNFHYVALPEPAPSPAKALNFGVKQARGQMVGVLIDGAHLVSPGVLNYALRAFKAYANPVVSTLALHLGPQLQRHSIKSGYTEQAEDDLLQQINWPQAGYQLFSISSLTGSNAGGWFLPIAESNCLFLLRQTYEALGGFDERFDLPGGGLVNLDFYYRLCEQLTTELIVLLGEGSFHQLHGGIATNNADDQAFQQDLARWLEQYQVIRGKTFSWSTRRPDYWGHLPHEMVPFVEHSVQQWVEKTQASPHPLHTPLISVVIVVHNMQRAAPRTLQSFTAAYQGISPEAYEVIVVENGSDQPLAKEQVEAFGPNFYYLALPEASPSPVGALNFGVKHAQGHMVGLMIDGARIITPGVLSYALRALNAYTNPVVSTLAWHLGPDAQYKAMRTGYSEEVEDRLLQQINWPEAGYQLFTISALADSSAKGWFLPIAESNCLFLLRRTYAEIGGFEERFDTPGGGLANLDFYHRLCEQPTTELIVLLGEGSFHQIHGGVATNNADEQTFQANARHWLEQYKAIRGLDFKPSPRRPDYWGHLPSAAIPFLNHSLQASTAELTARPTPPAPTSSTKTPEWWRLEKDQAVAFLNAKLEKHERTIDLLKANLEERERAVTSLKTQLQEQTRAVQPLQPAPAPVIARLRQELQAARTTAEATSAELESLRRTKFYRLAAFYWRGLDKLKTSLRLTRK